MTIRPGAPAGCVSGAYSQTCSFSSRLTRRYVTVAGTDTSLACSADASAFSRRRCAALCRETRSSASAADSEPVNSFTKRQNTDPFFFFSRIAAGYCFLLPGAYLRHRCSRIRSSASGPRSAASARRPLACTTRRSIRNSPDLGRSSSMAVKHAVQAFSTSRRTSSRSSFQNPIFPSEYANPVTIVSSCPSVVTTLKTPDSANSRTREQAPAFSNILSFFISDLRLRACTAGR